MLFEVRRQRIRGVPVSKDERSRIVPVRGDLRVQEASAEAMGRRLCRVATLHALDRAIEDQLLPPLHDVALLWIAPLGMVLGGIEFDGQGAFWQTWHVTPWDRSTSSVGRPRYLSAHDTVGQSRNAGRLELPCGSTSEPLSSHVESVCPQEARTVELASAHNAAVGDSNSP